MSLQVWLPLTGNLNNQGLLDVNLIYSGTPVFENGKIGKCLKSPFQIQILNPSLMYGKFSVAFWVKCKTGFSGDWKRIVSLRTANPSDPTSYVGMLRWEQASGLSYFRTLSSHNNAGYTIETGSSTYSTSTDIWIHMVYTYDNTTGKVIDYVNGIKANERTGKIGGRLDGQILIGEAYEGWINDFRLYDHCLSPKEVKEIAKAKILHYPMNQIDGVIGGRNLTRGSKEVKIWYCRYGNNLVHSVARSNQSYTVNGITVTNPYRVSFVAGGSGDMRFGQPTGTNDATDGSKYNLANKTYTMSVWVMSDKDCTLSSFVTRQYQDSDGSGASHTLVANQWKRISHSRTYSNRADLDGIRVRFTCGTTCNIIFCLGKVELGNIATLWTPAIEDMPSLKDNIVYDTSGYCNNGTVADATCPTWSDDGVVGMCSWKFNGLNNYIGCDRGAMVTDEITVSWWGWMSNWSQYTRAISCTEGGGWNFEPNSEKMSFPLYAGGAYRRAVSTSTLTNLLSGWHLFTGVYDGLVIKMYVDGELNSSVNCFSTKTPITYNATNGIVIGAEASSALNGVAGSWFNGLLQDVRIYATALSDSDVKELYETRFSLADNGSLFLTEYSEDDVDSVEMGKNGVLTSNNLTEYVELYDMQTKTLDDGSQWARIFYHNNHSGTVMFRASDKSNFATQPVIIDADRYSRLNLIEDFKRDDKYEFMACQPDDGDGVWRWTQTNNPVVSTSAGTVQLISGTTNEASGLMLCTGNTFLARSTSTGNWWCAIGSWSVYSGGIPGFGQKTVKGGLELWIRIPAVLNRNLQIYKDSIIANEIIEN